MQLRFFRRIASLALALILVGIVAFTAHAGPPLQEGDGANLRVINDSEETICFVGLCPIGAQTWDECPVATRTTIAPDENKAFDVPTGEYDLVLADCVGNTLLIEQGLAIAGQHTLTFTGSDPCQILNQQGLGLFYQGAYQEALLTFQDALSCYREADDRGGEGETLGYLGITYYALGQYPVAIDYHEQALSIAQAIGDRRNEGNHLGNLGLVYRDLGEHKIAIDYHKQALAISREIGDRGGEAADLNNLALIYHQLGQYGTAVDYHEQALSIAQQIRNRGMEAKILGNLGNAYSSLGQYRQAVMFYEQALAIARDLGDRQGEASNLAGLGIAYTSLGQHATAADYHEEALAISRETGDRAGEGDDLGNLASAYLSMGEHQTAIEYYEQALAIARDIGDRHGEGNRLGNLGTAHEALGQHETAVEYYEQALAITRDLGDQQGEANKLGNLGSAYLSMGKHQAAIEYYEQALAIARDIGDRQGEGTLLGNLGRAYASSGKANRATQYYEQAIAIVEILRADLAVEAFKSSFAAQHAWPYQGMITALLKLSRFEEAFYYAQRAKARSFLDQLANVRIDPRVTHKPELIAEEQALLDDIRGLEALLSGRIQTSDDLPDDEASGRTDETRADIQAQLDAVYEDYEHLLARIKLSNPAYADLRAVDASTLITVQKTLPTEATLVDYYTVSDEQTLAFLVTPDDYHAIPLSVTTEALKETIDWFRQFPSRQATQQACRDLYEWLFAPLRKHIDTDVLLIAPDGWLHYLPFGALHDGEHHLIDDYTIGYIPSASVLRYINAEAPRSGDPEAMLVLGNPVNDAVQPLLAAEREARAVADLFDVPAHLKAEATESRLWEEAPAARHIHIAAHAEFNETAPQFSRLYLGADEAPEAASASRHDGLLETREVWSLRLDNADLVTLSGCQTQLGQLSAGSELIGLSRAFIYAGTPSLVASLWSVEDRSTAYLMERFYGYLREGRAKAQALRQAQLDTRDVYASPYHWAAFTLIGDMGEVSTRAMTSPSPARRTASRRSGIAASVLALALVATGLWMDHRQE